MGNAEVSKKNAVILKRKNSIDWKQVKKMKLLYVLLFFPAVHLFIFSFIPMYGIIIAFKDFNAGDGILGSPWTLDHFINLFKDVFFWRSFKNTVIISTYKIITGFAFPIVFALLLNEIKNLKFKKITQTISYLPYFMSWVVLAGLIVEVLSPQRGIVNYIITVFGFEPVDFLTNEALFRPVLVVTALYASLGWGAVIYLASLASVDICLYESADLDGANRLQKAVFISIPSIAPVITVVSILSLGGILNGGFEQVFNLYNPLVYSVGDIIDTYVYRSGLMDGRFDFATAVGLFKNVVAVALIFGTNKIVKSFSEYGVW